MKILFLDIDGVLAIPESGWGTDSKTWDKEFGYPVDKVCVNFLNEILKQTDAEIVLTSSWRLIYDTPERMKALFEHFGVIKCPIDKTIQIWGASRDLEITKWMEGREIQKYCILDDDFISIPNHVHCNINNGLTRIEADQALAILNAQSLHNSIR